MPLVQINVCDSMSEDLACQIGEAINIVMETVLNVPKGDKFQIISRTPAGARNMTPSYLGIEYSKDLVVIQITLNQGRTVAMKKAFYLQVAENLTALGIRRQDIIISLVEVPRENWSFGNGEMQYEPIA